MQKKEHDKWTVWLVAAFGAVIMMLCQGCATPIRISPATVDGRPGLAVNMGANAVQEEEGFFQRHWGKMLTAVAAVGTIVAVGEKNEWFKGGDRETKVKEVAPLPTMNDVNSDVIVVNVGSGTVVVENNGAE